MGPDAHRVWKLRKRYANWRTWCQYKRICDLWIVRILSITIWVTLAKFLQQMRVKWELTFCPWAGDVD